MNHAFNRALNRVRQDGRFTVQEMADVAGCSTRHLYHVCDLTHPADLSVEKAGKLARWLCRQGEVRPSETFACASYVLTRRGEGVANGSVIDQVLDTMEASTDAKRAHAERDPEKLDEAIGVLRGVVRDLEAEKDAIA